MHLLRPGLTLLVVICLLAPAAGAFAPQPPNFVGATVVFRDAPAEGSASLDRIRSDGKGAYVNGAERGLEVRMWVNGSQDLTIGLFNSSRRIHFDYRQGPEVTIIPTAPTGYLVDNAFVNIRAIADMQNSEIRMTKASFNTAIGNFRWLGSPYPPGGVFQSDSYGSMAVKVVRNGQTWVVSTPYPEEQFSQDPDYFAGDLSVLLVGGRKGELTPAALYRMPFGLTVTCTACP